MQLWHEVGSASTAEWRWERQKYGTTAHTTVMSQVDATWTNSVKDNKVHKTRASAMEQFH